METDSGWDESDAFFPSRTMQDKPDIIPAEKQHQRSFDDKLVPVVMENYQAHRYCNYRLNQTCRYFVLTMLSIITGFLLAIFSSNAFLHPATTIKKGSSSSSTASNCGNSSTEALSLGCEFDVMRYAWVQPACYNATLSSSMFAAGDWFWSLDDERTQSIPVSDIQSARYETVYTNDTYHVAHCVYVWKLQIQALLQADVVDDDILNEDHTEHCIMELTRERFDWEYVILVLGFLSCGPLFGQDGSSIHP